MTLRVTVEVVPFGREEDIYLVHELDISNIGQVAPMGHCEYVFDLDGKGMASETVVHNRSDGALELIRKVLATEWIKENGNDE